MKKFVIGYLHYSDNELQLSVVEAKDWWEAIQVCPLFKDQDWLHEIPRDLEDTKEYFFDTDMAINVLEIAN